MTGLNSDNEGMQIIILFLAIALTACGSKHDSLSAPAGELIENISCPQSESRLYDILYTSLLDLETVPSEEELKNVFGKALKAHPDIVLEEEKFLELVTEFYQIILQAPSGDPSQMLEKITAMEVGDQTTEEARAVQSQLQKFQAKWDRYRAQQKSTCNETPGLVPPGSSGAVLESRALFGARKSMATAYQSCEAVEKAAMTSETPSVEGIKRVGTHPDGVGGKRQIVDLKAVQKTDYYLQTSDRNSSCMDVSTNPMIYDYGGKPFTTSAEDSSLNFFKNAGSGTSALGIDCSGFVFSAVATGGLKIHPTKKMKAVLVHGINARMFMDPANNGMPCFEKVKMGISGTLKPGDIAAISGHVIMIDSVGKDPFGISRAQTIDECNSLTADGFSFNIIQSSPSKNGIGINRYFATDYLQDESGTMRGGFEKYARAACRAKFQKTDVPMLASGFQVIRHKQSPSCMDKPIALTGESCANSCRSLMSQAEM